MIHLFHKWEQLFKKRSIAFRDRLFSYGIKEYVMVILEKCSVCGKYKARFVYLDGRVEKISPEWAKELAET